MVINIHAQWTENTFLYVVLFNFCSTCMNMSKHIPVNPIIFWIIHFILQSFHTLQFSTIEFIEPLLTLQKERGQIFFKKQTELVCSMLNLCVYWVCFCNPGTWLGVNLLQYQLQWPPFPCPIILLPALYSLLWLQLYAVYFTWWHFSESVVVEEATYID